MTIDNDQEMNIRDEAPVLMIGGPVAGECVYFNKTIHKETYGVPDVARGYRRGLQEEEWYDHFIYKRFIVQTENYGPFVFYAPPDMNIDDILYTLMEAYKEQVIHQAGSGR